MPLSISRVNITNRYKPTYFFVSTTYVYSGLIQTYCRHHCVVENIFNKEKHFIFYFVK